MEEWLVSLGEGWQGEGLGLEGWGFPELGISKFSQEWPEGRI